MPPATPWSRRTGSTASRCRPSSCVSSTAACASCARFPSKTTSRACPEAHPERKEIPAQMKKNVLIIGAGGVGQVVAHKCAQHNDVLGDIHIASRTFAKCEAIVQSVHEKKSLKTAGKLVAHALDALDVEKTAELIRATNS